MLPQEQVVARIVKSLILLRECILNIIFMRVPPGACPLLSRSNIELAWTSLVVTVKMQRNACSFCPSSFSDRPLTRSTQKLAALR